MGEPFRIDVVSWVSHLLVGSGKDARYRNRAVMAVGLFSDRVLHSIDGHTAFRGVCLHIEEGELGDLGRLHAEPSDEGLMTAVIADWMLIDDIAERERHGGRMPTGITLLIEGVVEKDGKWCVTVAADKYVSIEAVSFTRESVVTAQVAESEPVAEVR